MEDELMFIEQQELDPFPTKYTKDKIGLESYMFINVMRLHAYLMDFFIKTLYPNIIDNVHWATKSLPPATQFPFTFLTLPNGPCKPFNSRFFYKRFYKVASMVTF